MESWFWGFDMNVHGRTSVGTCRWRLPKIVLLATFAVSAITAQAAEDCSRINQTAQKVLGTSSRMVVTALPPEGSICNIQLRDSGIRTSPVGRLAVTTFGHDSGPPLADYRPSAGRCESIEGVGDKAALCVVSEDYNHHRFSLVVYREGRKALELNFFDWPSAANPARDEARSLANNILGPYGPAVRQLKEPVLGAFVRDDGQAERLMRALLPKAEAGNTEAEFALARLYQYGLHGTDGKIRPDFPAAAYWYQQATAMNMAEAAYALGTLYRDGRGVAVDSNKAILLFEEAANAGNIHAMLALAELYATRGANWNSYYMPWLRKAEGAGSAAASNQLGVLSYEEGLHEGRGFEGFRQRNLDEAMREFRKAAAGGDCDATLNVGGMYFNGDGVPQNRNRAKDWFSKAAVCKDASDSTRKKAAHYLDKASNGGLPSVRTYEQPAATDSLAASGISGRDVLLGLLVIGMAAAVARDIAHGPYTEKELQQIHDEQLHYEEKMQKIKREEEREICYERLGRDAIACAFP